VKRLKRLNYLRWLLRFEWVKQWLAKKIDQQPAGPSEKQLEQAITYVWGEVRNDQGEQQQLRLKVMNGYRLTSYGAVDIALYVLAQQPKGGFYTPSLLCGKEWVQRYVVD